MVNQRGGPGSTGLTSEPLTYGDVSRQHSLVHGEGPDVEVVHRRHPVHSQQTFPHLAVLQACRSTWGGAGGVRR